VGSIGEVLAVIRLRNSFPGRTERNVTGDISKKAEIIKRIPAADFYL